LRPDINRYLRWAFVEAANVVALHHLRRPERHVSRLYARLKQLSAAQPQPRVPGNSEALTAGQTPGRRAE